MNLLAIETSSPVLSVAIKKSGAKLRHATIQGYMQHAENILPVIDRLLKKERLKIGDIDAFLIGRGPGSFTGLRVGFATLKGLLATCPKPCYGALSLDIIASGIIPLLKPGLRSEIGSKTGFQKGPNLTVCVDAKRGKLYTRSYRYLRKGWVPSGPCRVAPVGEIVPESSRNTRLVGDGLTKIGSRAASEGHEFPRASALIKLFEARDPLLKKLRRPGEFLPVYLRRSEPEEKLLEKKA
jgi:tRNA threonylcarbamoyladenosine biosynthesis protein TsaB